MPIDAKVDVDIPEEFSDYASPSNAISSIAEHSGFFWSMPNLATLPKARNIVGP